MGYDRRLIVDYDDTISITTTRDWTNAEPIWPVINKVNTLYDKGWEVWIVTARGQLSCKGDWEAADKKYREGITKWLNKYGVKFHELRFEKYLASYYIDDKALLPEDFVDLEFKEIKTGWSGAGVEKRGNRIFKTHHDSLEAARWYKMAAPLVNVPIVHSMIGETLCLEFIEDNGQYFKLDEVNSAINKFKLYKTPQCYHKYIDRVNKHIDHNDMFHKIKPFLYNIDVVCNKRSSFMHGDLSLENVIQSDRGLYFIDPIYSEDGWSSYLLDISKMLHSFRKYNRMFEYEVFMNMWVEAGEDRATLEILEITQWIRVIKYIPDEELKTEYTILTNKLIEDFIIGSIPKSI